MKSIIELELELATAKLEKMTSTVKQLGTKLKDANENAMILGHELSWCKDENKKLKLFRDSIRKIALTKDESHSQAVSEPPFKPNF